VDDTSLEPGMKLRCGQSEKVSCGDGKVLLEGYSREQERVE